MIICLPGIPLSKKQIKKNMRRAKRAKFCNREESATDYLDDDYLDNDAGDEEDSDGSPKSDEGPMPTLEELDPSVVGVDDASMTQFIPLHRPRPTPQEWRRHEEHCPLLLPADRTDIASSRCCSEACIMLHRVNI